MRLGLGFLSISGIEVSMSPDKIAVIGAGFSGTLLALHALRRCPHNTTVTLIERNRQFGRGQAYATGNPSHLLNVPAGRMSAFHDNPHHFVAWLREHPQEAAALGVAPGTEEGAFVPRSLFGSYVRSLLNAELKEDERLELVRGDAHDLCCGPDGRLQIMLGQGATERVVEADRVVLATGNFPPAPPPVEDPSFFDTPFYSPDPWAADALTQLEPGAPVFLIGTGLTMVDVAVSLLDQGHHGPIMAVSRRGLVPLRHGGGALPPLRSSARQSHPDTELSPDDAAFPTTINDLLHFLRQEAARSIASGESWQPVVDSLRPFTIDVWQTMPMRDRARFLRHLRPWWDIHRHRVPPATADRITDARARGQLRIAAGRIRAFDITDQGEVLIRWRKRGEADLTSTRAVRVINCSGPCADYARIGHPLIRALLDRGSVRPDPLGLGLEVTGNCALLDKAGRISRRLFAVGPITKGAFWEMTAVPDIRRQAEFVAGHLAALIKASPCRAA
ncbi:Pyridine nucleotide-disulfide oxidoreductase family [Granulibacter bethesdensis]|nr:Pyridine nucleotide-disulfide oxidoreductase family [Granulibacter bethesdensis]